MIDGINHLKPKFFCGVLLVFLSTSTDKLLLELDRLDSVDSSKTCIPLVGRDTSSSPGLLANPTLSS